MHNPASELGGGGLRDLLGVPSDPMILSLTLQPETTHSTVF